MDQLLESGQPQITVQQSHSDSLWYKDALIYEVHVRAFNDSNNDGVGDFPGLTEKLPYLADLGVTCLWLLPFYPSPLRDDGYDISGYTSINPIYGSLDDFRRGAGNHFPCNRFPVATFRGPPAVRGGSR